MADGSIVICKRADWDAQGFSIPPREIGLYEGEFLGVDCAWGYFGDNLSGTNYYDGSAWCDQFYLTRTSRDGDYRETTEEEQAEIKRAAQWFESHAEVHEVWT